MMKQLKHILLAALALAFLTMSCIDPLEPMPKGLDARLPDKALVFSPSILGSTIVTKAINTGVDELGELAIETLDVYVYKVNDLTKPFKRYHFITEMPEGVSTLPDGVTLLAAAALASGTDIVLETDWRQAGYDQTGTQKYRIYSIANSRMADSDRWADLSEANLKAMTITSAETHYGSYDIVRPKDGVGPGNDYYNIHIKDKNFLMDGMIDDWAITINESQQYFTLNTDKSFPLTRAAAKFIVNVSFDPDFLEELDDEETVLSPHMDGETPVSTTGAPRFKFANFMPVSYEATPNTTPSGTWRDANLWNSRYNYDFPEYDLEGELNDDPTSDKYVGKATYTLTTYSYSFAWEDSADGAIHAPALVLLVNYQTEDAPAETFFYRVPLVDLTKISSIERNYLYVVDATISSKGTIIEDIIPTNVNLRYKVIPWPASIRPEDVTEVEGANLLYFTADTTYTLRGENVQSTKLEYFTPKSVKGTIGHYEYEPKISNIKVYFKPSADETTMMMEVNSPSNQYSWEGSNTRYSGSRVVITVTPNKDGGGTIDISSNVLANRAVKYIEFDASVMFTVTDSETGTTTTSTVTHHYFIKHFPLDNIQSVLGFWSSRWDGQPAGTRTIYYRNIYARTTTGIHEISQQQWAVGIGNSNDVRKAANSFENRSEDGYYATGSERTATASQSSGEPRGGSYTITWNGTSSVTIRESNGSRTMTVNMPYNNITYDYVNEYRRPGNTGYADLVKYQHYYFYGEYQDTSDNPIREGWEEGTYSFLREEPCSPEEYAAAMSGRTETVSSPPSTGEWVVYNGGGNHEYRDMNYNNGYGYYAKVATTNAIHNMTASGSDSGSGNVVGNNVHMYVIQISKAETNVVLGHPRLDDDNQSSDNVVSPAFMIASQLGAVRSASFTNAPKRAAEHCATYMEVASNDRRFVNWRLPTKAEIAYIASYQNNNNIQGQGVFTYVLTGNYYYTLDGGDAPSNYPPSAPDYDGDDDTRYVRCIRDLTPSEVEELNRTGFITDASY